MERTSLGISLRMKLLCEFFFLFKEIIFTQNSMWAPVELYDPILRKPKIQHDRCENKITQPEWHGLI